MNMSQSLPSPSAPASASGRRLKWIASAFAAVFWAVAKFWNIPPLGTIEPHRSPLLRHNWYV